MDPMLQARLNEAVGRVAPHVTRWLYRYRRVDPIIQSGPQCGPVALCMALQTLGVGSFSVKDIMQHAIDAHYSRHGEMFDARHLHALALGYYNANNTSTGIENATASALATTITPTIMCRLVAFEAESSDRERGTQLLAELSCGRLVLIAYDCDFNFEPCNKSGAKAHWALLVGCVLPANDDDNSTRNAQQNVDRDVEDKPPALALVLLDQTTTAMCASDNDSEHAFVIGQHGKSKHAAAWSVQRLLASNRQLRHADELKCNQADLIRPNDGDLQRTLANQMIVLDCKNS